MTYPKLIKNNISVFTFDFSGHGESEGKREDVTVSQAIDDLKCALDFIEKKDFINKNKIGLLGSSFGGMTSIFVVSKDKRIKVLALKAPLIRHRFFLEKTWNIEEWKNKGYIYREYRNVGKVKINYSFYEDGIKYNSLDVVKKIKVPTLIVVGDKDVTVFTEKVKEFFDLLECEKELHLIKGAEHWFTDEEKKELFEYVNNWIIKWLK